MRTKSSNFRKSSKKNFNKSSGNGGSKSAWKQVGTIFQKKDGSGFFLKINENVELEEGQILNLDSPQDVVERLFELGHLSEEQAEERLAKIPETIKFNVVQPPPRD